MGLVTYVNDILQVGHKHPVFQFHRSQDTNITVGQPDASTTIGHHGPCEKWLVIFQNGKDINSVTVGDIPESQNTVAFVNPFGYHVKYGIHIVYIKKPNRVLNPVGFKSDQEILRLLDRFFSLRFFLNDFRGLSLHHLHQLETHKSVKRTTTVGPATDKDIRDDLNLVGPD